MKKLLVTGASGLLGMNLALGLSKKYQIFGVANHLTLQGIPFEMIQRDFFRKDVAAELIDTVQPDAVIHCAAMANVDACEKNPEAATELNGEFPGRLAGETAKRHIPMIHISTDAVFDGKERKENGYTENDLPHPINVYARSKLLGEQKVFETNPDAVVARVNFYGWSVAGNRSLSEFFYANLKSGQRVFGFTDVFFCPLYVWDLAEILEKLLLKNAKGLYHVFSPEFLSKYEFGVNIAGKFGFDPNLIQPVSWQAGGLDAPRSPYLIMNTDKLREFLGESLPDQETCLNHFYEAEKSGLPELIRSFRTDNS